MAKVYSMDLRERLIDAVASGSSARSAGRLYRVSASTAIKWVQHWHRTGAVPAPRPRKRYRLRLDVHHDWLLALIDAEPDLTLAEIQTRLRDARGFESSMNSVWRFFERQGVSFKKNRARRRAGQAGRGGVEAALEGSSTSS